MTTEKVRLQFLDAAGLVTGEATIPIPGPPVPPPPPPPPPPVDPPVDPPAGDLAPPGPLPELIATHHDVVRLQGRKYTIAVAKHGRSSDPSTWTGGRLPTPADRVLIQGAAGGLPGATVLLDGVLECSTLIVGGLLAAQPAATSGIRFGTMTVLPGGEFRAGTRELPVVGSCRLTVRNVPIDPVEDPGGYGTGVLVFGRFRTCGRPKTPHVRIGGELRAGDSGVWLASPVSGWQAGDAVVFHDTRELKDKEIGKNYVPQWERRWLTGKDPIDLLELDIPLGYAHGGARDADGNLDTTMKVANLTRSVVLESEDVGQLAGGTPGHFQAFDRAELSLQFTGFEGLGRTRNIPINDDPLKGELNPIGRYSVHLHHVAGALVPVAGVPQWVIFGCVVDGGDDNHDRKWAIAIHDSSDGLVEGNCIYNAMGAGIVFEEGNERDVLVSDNWVVRIGGAGGRADAAERQGGQAMQGSGIYLKSPFSQCIKNYVANAFNYGYIITLFYLGKKKVSTGPGADPHHDFIEIDGNAAGVGVFEGNEAASCESGLTWWWLGSVNQKPIPGALVSYIKDFKSWNHRLYGIFQYQCHKTILEGFTTRGQGGALSYLGMDYLASELLVKGANIAGARTGFSPSVYEGEQVFEDCTIQANAGFNFSLPWTNGSDARGLKARKVTIRRCKFRGNGTTPWVAVARNWPAVVGSKTQSAIVSDRVLVEDFQGVKGDSFEVYYPKEQAGDYVPPATILNEKYAVGAERFSGSPRPGQTNRQLFDALGVAVAGRVAPASAKGRPNIVGVVAPIQALPA